MTKIINILSASNVEFNFVRQPIEFYLAHIILKHKDVYKKARLGNYYKIVDCSACELGTGVDMSKVLEAADIVGANEIVLPDIVKSNTSLDVSLKALSKLDEETLARYNIAIVIQSSNLVEAMCNIDKLRQKRQLKKINTIMIPKWFTTFERIVLTKKVQECMPDKQIHWLGLGDDIDFCLHNAKELKIRSLDTGYFISIAQKSIGRVYEAVRDKKHRINLDKNCLNEQQINAVINATSNLSCAEREEMRDIVFSARLLRTTIVVISVLLIALFLFVLLK